MIAMTRFLPLRTVLLAAILSITLPGCAILNEEKKKEEEAIKNTVDCKRDDERILIRFDRDEVRVLMPNGERIYLYKMPSARGVLYTNGDIELLGKGTNVSFGPVGELRKLDCKPYSASDKDQRDDDRKGLKEMNVY